MKRLLCLCLSLLLLPAPAAAFAERADVRAFIADMEARHGFGADELARHFAAAQPLPAVIRLVSPPANPGARSWQAYRARFVEARRVAAGVDFWRAHPAALARAEARYGVPREIIVGIIGVETYYGRYTGRHPTFSALATLAFDYPPRAALFRKELESLLLLARDERRDPHDYLGSYAGALGLPQFLPSSIRQWAVDFDGDGRIDLGASVDDAIGSVANYLAAHGWQQDGPITAAASAEGARVGELLAEGIRPQRLPDELAAFGVAAPGAPAQPAALIDYVTPGAATEYRLGYRNFYVITRYNRSSFYATAVEDLAAAVKLEMDSAIAQD